MAAVRRWSGSVWADVTRKRWNGSAWLSLGVATPPAPAGIPAGYSLAAFSTTTQVTPMVSPPTITEIGVMDPVTKPSPLGATFTRLAWNDARLRPVGLHAESMPGSTSGPALGSANSKLRAGPVTRSPFAVEFVLTGGSKFAVNFGGSQALHWWVFVDGKPVSTDPLTYGSAIAWNQVKSAIVDFGSVGTRTIRVEMSGPAFAGIDVETTATVTATPPKRRLGIYGDSWVEGTALGATVDSKLTHMGWMLGRALNADIYVAGVGGTGYVNGFDVRQYGHASRLDPWAGLTLDEMVIFGTINDSGTGVQAAAAAMYADLATRMPSTKLIIFSVESYASSQNVAPVSPSVDWQVKQAAIAAPNVLGFISPRQEAWVTGSGNTTTPAGNGTADLYHNGNNINHLSLAGNRYYAEKMAAHVAALKPA